MFGFCTLLSMGGKLIELFKKYNFDPILYKYLQNTYTYHWNDWDCDAPADYICQAPCIDV